jgi:hypothetical protein
MLKLIGAFLVFLLGFFPAISLAWNGLGHEVIAQIAYDHLSTPAKHAVNSLNFKYRHLFPRTRLFDQSATWADRIKGNDVHAFDSWHFINLSFSPDGSVLPKIPKENVVWAINQSLATLQSPKASSFEQALFLRFLIHFVGDVHQPLHCVTRVTKRHPTGDQGGNLFVIRSTQAHNLHSLWDRGLGLFAYRPHLRFSRIQRIAQRIENQYPRSYFGRKITITDPAVWARESFVLAKNVAYHLPENTVPSRAYVKAGRAVVEQRVALAGYRLAYLLNQVYRSRAGS